MLVVKTCKLLLGYGTGKTLLLAYKATQLLQSGEPVLFLICTEDTEPIPLTQHLRKCLHNALDEEKIDLLELQQVSRNDLHQMVVDNFNQKHIFVDEVPSSVAGHTEQRSRHMARERFLWMAVDSSRLDVLSAPVVSHKLSKCFRNEANIVKYIHNGGFGPAPVKEGGNKVVTIFYTGEDPIMNAAIKSAVLMAKNKVLGALWIIHTE